MIFVEEKTFPMEIESKQFDKIVQINESLLILKNNLHIPQYFNSVYMLFEKIDKTERYNYLISVEGALYGKVSSKNISKEILYGLRSSYDKKVIVIQYFEELHSKCYENIIKYFPETIKGSKSCGDIYM